MLKNYFHGPLDLDSSRRSGNQMTRITSEIKTNLYNKLSKKIVLKQIDNEGIMNKRHSMVMVLRGIGQQSVVSNNNDLKKLDTAIPTSLQLLNSQYTPATPPSAAIMVNKIKPSPHPSEAYRSFRETIRRHTEQGKLKDYVKSNLVDADQDALGTGSSLERMTGNSGNNHMYQRHGSKLVKLNTDLVEERKEEHGLGNDGGPSYLSSDRSHLDSHRILESRLIKTAEEYQRSQLIKNANLNFQHNNNKLSTKNIDSTTTFYKAPFSMSKVTLHMSTKNVPHVSQVGFGFGEPRSMSKNLAKNDRQFKKFSNVPNSNLTSRSSFIGVNQNKDMRQVYEQVNDSQTFMSMIGRKEDGVNDGSYLSMRSLSRINNISPNHVEGDPRIYKT